MPWATTATRCGPGICREQFHQTFWTTRQMCETIRRRDPTRPAFWYCSYAAPHPPITPPADYLRHYEHFGVDDPFVGDWARDFETLPYALKLHRGRRNEGLDGDEISRGAHGLLRAVPRTSITRSAC